MEKRLLHTPEGVKDLYDDACVRKQFVLSSLGNTLNKFGFSRIETPTFEFFDIFGKEVGTIPSKDLYKFFDKEGNTLALRPDITPSIARAAAKYFPIEQQSVRLSYQGNVYINNQRYQGRLKETTQFGGEIIGDGSLCADSEIIAVAVKCLKELGLHQFQISISHADLLKGFIEAAGLEEEDEINVKTLISNKNYFGVEEYLEHLNVSQEVLTIFQGLKTMYSSSAEWQSLKDNSKNYPKIYQALCYLEKLDELLTLYNVQDYVSYELSMMRDYQYYTGIIFSGYTYGIGEPMVSGGRYDKLLSYFGKEAPAIGFAIMVDPLLLALQRQKISLYETEVKNVVLYHKSQCNVAIQKANELRLKDEPTTLIELPEDEEEVEQLLMYYKKENIILINGENK